MLPAPLAKARFSAAMAFSDAVDGPRMEGESEGSSSHAIGEEKGRETKDEQGDSPLECDSEGIELCIDPDGDRERNSPGSVPKAAVKHSSSTAEELEVYWVS